MKEEKKTAVVLCGANAYAKKYYLNPAFAKLPEAIKRELQILCASIAEEAGGILTLEYDTGGNLNFKMQADDGDYLFDEIAGGMEVSRARRRHQEMLEALELYYKAIYSEI